MTLVLFTTSVTVLALSAVSNLVPESVTETMERAVQGLAIMDDERLRWWCVLGAFCGAWVNVGIWRPKGTHEIIWKWVTSFFASIIFMPAIIEYMAWGHTSTVALAASGAGAVLGWTLIQGIAPAITAIASTRLGSAARALFGVTEENKEDYKEESKPHKRKTANSTQKLKP